MSTNMYPTIDEASLRTIHKMAVSIPGYLEDPACPYSDHTKMILGGGAGQKAVAAVISEESLEDAIELIEINFETAGDDALLNEITSVYAKLKRYGEKIKDDNDNSSGNNTFFRLSVSMLKEVVDIRKKLLEAVNMSKFIEDVMCVLEDLVGPDGRNEFMERMKYVPRRKKEGTDESTVE